MIVEERGIKIRTYPGKITSRLPVFYNPHQVLNRDVCESLIVALKPKKAIDLLAGTGVRGLRLLRHGIDVVFNDRNSKAYEDIKENLKINGMHADVYNMDANRLLYTLDTKFDYIDVDPFGSPLPFLDSAVKFLKRGGILGITATDIASLSGTYPKKCLVRYGSVSRRVIFYREMGIRILIKKVVEIGAQYGYALRPILSHATRHYFRVYFVKESKPYELVKNVGSIQFDNRSLKFGEGDLIGPLFLDKIQDASIVKKAFDNSVGDAVRLLGTIYMEADAPNFYYTTDAVAKLMRIEEPKIDYVVSKVNGVRTHFDPKGFKTELNIDEITQRI
ncbi:hypothetical protein DRN75_00430 [Nanoarchaeota archaeon]|nr:MAG: hypothetical protein DRN75_00430 [Nanoarchaeota archaeon]